MIEKIALANHSLPASSLRGGAVKMGEDFAEALNNAVEGLNKQQSQVNQLTEKFIQGELTDVSQLTIASEKAALGLELTVQLRNKAVEAYQEIMRIQL
ncbi:flagellar hook-basal body complex protein FliE [Marinicrinis lubricantis]|uniref:Flagellar hook-basal body complex protein FliE n=1 Tax=Marinicrinis lubricantis TaxID=2086470 RepID=A0ABW1IMF1_9BACL